MLRQVGDEDSEHDEAGDAAVSGGPSEEQDAEAYTETEKLKMSG